MSKSSLGVDLGTTWTAAAVQHAPGTPAEPLTLAGGHPAMPSVVAVVDGDVIVGEKAARVSATDPASVAREFKRRLGDATPIVVAGIPFGAETLMGHLLGHVVGTAREAGVDVATVALTHPATWGDYKLDLLREAGRVAGVGEIGLVSEPEAAALHHAGLGRLGTDDTVLVYDFGGGTFDAAVVRLARDGTEILGRPEGLERLGGIDLDQAVVALVDTALDGALTQLDRNDPAVRRGLLALRQECTRAKEALSADTETTVPVLVPGLDTSVRITRPELEAAVRPRLAETLGSVDRVVASAGLQAGDLAGILLVGGSSRIPLVAELVAAHTGRPLLRDTDPKLAVCLGAAAPVPPLHQEPAMTSSTPPQPPPSGAEATPAPNPNPPGGAEAKPAAKDRATATRRTQPDRHPRESAGPSVAGKVAAGVAAAGVAAAAVIWRDDLTNAVFGDNDGLTDQAAMVGAASAASAATLDAVAPPETPAESMDAFDAPARPGGSSGAGSGAGSGGGGGGGGGGGSRGGGGRSDGDGGGGGFTAAGSGRPASDGRGEPSAAGMPPEADPAFETARARLSERLEGWQPPEGADPAETAALKARLDDLVDRFQPRPGQSTEDAMAELREQFDLRVDNFVQDQRIDTLIEQEEREDLLEQIDEAVTGGVEAPTDEQEREDLLEQIEDAVSGGEAADAGGAAATDGAPAMSPATGPAVPAPREGYEWVDDHWERERAPETTTDTTASSPAATGAAGPEGGPTIRDHRGDTATAEPTGPEGGPTIRDHRGDTEGDDSLLDPFETLIAEPARPAAQVATSPAFDAPVDSPEETWDPEVTVPDAAMVDVDVLGTAAVDAAAATPLVGVLTAPTPSADAGAGTPFEADPLGLPRPDQPVVPAADDELDLQPADPDVDLTPTADVADFDDDRDFAPEAEPEPDLGLSPDAGDDPSFL